jgi:serine/threonine protein phosphatase PrpC
MERLHGELEGHGFRAGWGQQDKVPGHNEDAVYAYTDPENGNTAFAVFDGVGGHVGGAVASSAAREGLHEVMLNNEGTGFNRSALNDNDGLKNAVRQMQRSVVQALKELPPELKQEANKAGGGGTTALVAFLHEAPELQKGQKYLDVAAVGDSLGYIVRGYGAIEPLNYEETFARGVIDEYHENVRKGLKPAPPSIEPQYGSIVVNVLGVSPTGKPNFTGLRERYRFVVNPGDYVVLTSDGITGDNENQRMQGNSNESTIQWIVSRSDLTPKQKAEQLIEYATKRDDRTALVVEVGAEDGHGVSEHVKRANAGRHAAGLAIVK